MPTDWSTTDSMGNLRMGTHFCEFHSTRAELTARLIPYFIDGLQHDEFCAWVTSDPAGVEETERSLRNAAPHLGRYLDSGQIEILDCRDWYLPGGQFDGDRVLGQWADKEKRCLDSGFKALRATGDMAWLEKSDWQKFMDYEAEVDRVLPQLRVIGLCTYPLNDRTTDEVLHVIRNHQFALGLPAEASESDQLHQFCAHALQQQDEERRWIAAQLHEVTAQNVVAIRFYLASLRQRGTWPAEIESLIANCHSLCEQSLEQILTLSNLLHPPILDQLGLAASLRQYVLDFMKESGSVQVDFETPSEIGRLPREMETHLFRVAQVRLSELAHRSGNVQAIVRLNRQGEQVVLQIEDFHSDAPFPATAVMPETRNADLAILAMQQRLHKIGGRLEIRSNSQGTMLTASVPF